jgi:hypothetical protein
MRKKTLIGMVLMAAHFIILPRALCAFDNETQAERRAKSEFQSLERRGWISDRGDLYESLLCSWNKQLMEDENGIKVHVIGYGSGSASSPEEAEKQALQKAYDHFPGLMVMYFQSWNMASQMDGSLNNEEAEAIKKAINASEAAITKAYLALEMPPTLNIRRERRNSWEVNVRVLYSQMKLRDIARDIIADELVQKEGWSRDLAIRRLTYKK